MTKYGVSRYGSGFKYGETSAVSVYYNANLVATTSDYNTVTINWTNFSTDPSDGAPSSSWFWKLVKSYTGTHDNPLDGTTLAGGQYAGTGANFLTTYQDIDTNLTDVQVSYSLWVFTGSRWVLCGADYEYIVQDTGTLNTLTSWIPKAWLNSSGLLGDATGQNESSNTLVLTLEAFAFTYDKLRLEAALLAKSNDKTYSPIQILSYKLANFGFLPEPSLGDSYHRSLVAAGNSITKYKGTPLGISIYTTALTHLSNNVVTGHNLMLDYNDSSFEQSVGRWQVSSGTLSSVSYTTATFGPPTSSVLHDITTIPSALGFGQLTTAATTAVTMSLPGSSYTVASAGGITNYGVPVKPNTRYVFSGWTRHLNNSATITINITWYNIFGTSISSTGVGATYTTTTSWQEIRSKSDSGRNGQLSPINAAYAAVTLTVTPSSSSTSNYAFDFFQFSEYTKSFEYQDARRVNVYIRGEKENYVPNPDFQYGLGSWTGYNGTLSYDGTSTYAVHGGGAAKLTVTGTTDAAFVSDWIPVDPGKIHTFSAYVTGSSAKNAVLTIEYSTQETSDLQTQVLSDTNGQYYPTTINSYSSSGGTSTITAASGDGIHVTYTGDNLFQVGQSITITGMSPTTYNLSNVVITSITSQDFTVASTVTDAFVYGGTATVNPVTLSTTAPTQIIVTSVSPPYGRDSGLPVAKLSIYFPSATTATSDAFWIDGVMLEQAPVASPYFSGSGGVTPTNPVVSPYYSINNCWWEIKNRYNYISNPGFNSGGSGSTTDWVAGTGTTLTAVSTDGTYTTAQSGTYFGKLAFASGVSGSVTGTAYLPYAAIGGEDVSFSIYVRGFTGTVTATVAGTSTSQAINSTNATGWVRLTTVGQLAAGATTVAIGVSVTGVSGQTFIHIDSAQVEYGRIANTYVDTADTNTLTIVNPVTTTKNLYASQIEPASGGKGSFFYNYGIKSTRLNNNLPLVMPIGATYAVKTGVPDVGYTDLTESLIPSASFEKDLGQWVAVGTSATLTRTVSKGYLLGDTVTQGQAYCTVSNAGAVTTFGLKTSNVYITANGGYYASAAIRPGTNAVSGTYTLSVLFYNAANTLLYTGTTTKTFNQTSRWNYILGTYPINSITGATYAVLQISYTTTTGNANQNFQVDRVVFRQ